MKSRKKILLGILLSISILFSLLIENNYAVEETEQDNNQQTEGTQETQTTTTQQQQTTSTNSGNSGTATTTKKTTAKSNNANLSDLGITPNDFKGFKPGTTSYTVEVPEETETVNVYAKAQHSKATVSGTGIKKLEKGENKAEVVVTAEDGTKKTYTITINRLSGTEEADTNEENGNLEDGNGLVELKISDLALTPEFKTDIYEYSVKYIGTDTKLDVEAKPTSADYTIEITGNENLQEGENIITILVYQSNGENVATYQITVNKSLVDEEALAREAVEKQKKQQKIIIGAVVGIIIVAIIVGLIIKKIRDKKIEKEYNDAHYLEYEDDEDEELPKAFKKQKNRSKVTSYEEDDDYEDYDYEEDEETARKKKEQLKQKFLNNYSNYEEDYQPDEETTVKKHNNKGKRFK